MRGELERNMPADAHAFMAGRADTRSVMQVSGGAHALPVSWPDEVARMVVEAARGSELGVDA
jgi:hypothetical protein